ncbi:hypothetical protein QFZ91_004590 [Paraburkholderia sp. JPY419]
MMDVFFVLFGQGRELDPLQMGLRSIVVFVIAIVLIRVSGRRSFGQRTPFDLVVVILLGAMLSRAIVGASPFIATVVASLVIVVCHRVLAWGVHTFAPFRAAGVRRRARGVQRRQVPRERNARGAHHAHRHRGKRAAENRLALDGQRGRRDPRTQWRGERDTQARVSA